MSLSLLAPIVTVLDNNALTGPPSPVVPSCVCPELAAKAANI
jgi:hypothetical protein